MCEVLSGLEGTREMLRKTNVVISSSVLTCIVGYCGITEQHWSPNSILPMRIIGDVETSLASVFLIVSRKKLNFNVTKLSRKNLPV